MKIGLSILLALALGACATPYQSTGLTGGFSETALAPDTYRIVFRGNGFTNGERASDFALLRAADLTIANGYRYFVVMDSVDSVQQSNVYVPQSSYTTGSATVSGNYIHGSAYTTTTGGYSIPILKPRSNLFVKFFKDEPANIEAFDASFISHSIRSKYQMVSSQDGSRVSTSGGVDPRVDSSSRETSPPPASDNRMARLASYGTAAKNEFAKMNCGKDMKLVSIADGNEVYQATCDSGKDQLLECNGVTCKPTK